MLLEAGSGSLKTQCHFQFTLYFLLAVQDMSFLLQSPCSPLKPLDP